MYQSNAMSRTWLFVSPLSESRRQCETAARHVWLSPVSSFGERFSSSRSRKPTVKGARHPLWAAVERPTVKYRQAKWYRGSKFATAQIYVL